MPEFLANFSSQITEYWERFTRKQKIQIVAIISTGLIALVALTLILSRPDYVVYDTNISQAEMNTIVTALNEAEIRNRYSDNGTTLEVESGKVDEVGLLLAGQGILTTGGFKYADAFVSSLSTTSDERDLKHQLAFENEINENLELLDLVETANVKFVIPDSKVFVFEDKKEASAAIILTLNGSMSDEQASNVASLITELVPNLSKENIKIMDARTSKLIYNGTSSNNEIGSINSYMEVQNLYEAKYEQDLEMLLLSSSEYDGATVLVNLAFDFDEVSVEEEAFSSPVDADSPYAKTVYIYQATGSNTEATGVPGTDANDATTYVVDNAGGSDSTLDINDTEFAIDRKITSTVKAKGEIQSSDSSVSIFLNKFKYYYQESLTADGTLDNITWKQFQIDNAGNKPFTVDQSIFDIVVNASLIDNVNILGTEVPLFIDTPAVDNQVADYIPVIIIVLMIAMLGYAVYRGTEPVEITEIEPELSVEEMLASTAKVSDELDAIEMNGKSEARVQIERFVDENPEAVAQLLRNWLDDEWE